MQFLDRIFFRGRRLKWMSSLAGSPLEAVRLVLAMRRDPWALHALSACDGSIHFRAVDEQALKEVLVDREYSFLDKVVAARLAPKVLDIGAHIGTFAIWVARANPAADILSVEADPRTYQVMCRNAEARPPRRGSWTVLHAAAGASDGDVVRLLTDGPAMGHRVDAAGTEAVMTASLPSLVDRLAGPNGRIDVLKIDIEGSEEVFLCAAPDVLDRVDQVVIELHPALCDCDRVYRVLRAHYDAIVDIKARASSKPLLHCWRSASGPAAA